jgi:membrane carboxypeptidase/penicillin-binding protein PbpC
VAADRPLNSVLAQTSDIPERLRRYTARESGHPAMSRPFEIRFPVPGAVIKLMRNDTALASLTVWASGGKPPFRWYVDGHSLADQTDSKIVWTPEGRGQVEFTVIDSTGKKAASTAWLD